MARPYRLQGENCFYHITSRGDDRQDIFISVYDYQQFLKYIAQAKQKYNFYLYAYVLMNNHYHLLLETTSPNLSQIMHYINSSYTAYYNIKRNKSGHLLQGRYKSILVDKDSYLLELTRYIHLNPVRAKMVEKPEEYKWSSYQGYLSSKGDGHIDKEQVKKDIPMPPDRYQQFMQESITNHQNPLKDVYAGFILGKARFIKEKLQGLKGIVTSKDFSYKGHLNERIGIKEVEQILKEGYGQTIEQLKGLKKHSVKEKKIAVYLLKRYSSLSNAEIGARFNVSYSAVSKITSAMDQQMAEDKGLKSEVEGIISHFKG